MLFANCSLSLSMLSSKNNGRYSKKLNLQKTAHEKVKQRWSWVETFLMKKARKAAKKLHLRCLTEWKTPKWRHYITLHIVPVSFNNIFQYILARWLITWNGDLKRSISWKCVIFCRQLTSITINPPFWNLLSKRFYKSTVIANKNFSFFWQATGKIRYCFFDGFVLFLGRYSLQI